MNNLNIPEGYQQVMPYLIVPGAARFFDFMQKVFGAREKMTTMRDVHTIMHAELWIGESTIMYADSTDQYPPSTAGLFVYVEDADATYAKALAEGATSVQEPVDQHYGRSAGIKDPVGNTWWLTSNK